MRGGAGACVIVRPVLMNDQERSPRIATGHRSAGSTEYLMNEKTMHRIKSILNGAGLVIALLFVYLIVRGV